MDSRPALDRQLNSQTFRSFYYLKDELVEFCRQEKLQTAGGKLELTERIAHYLDTGEKLTSKITAAPKSEIGEITINSIIEDTFVCSEKHRVFFKKVIGNSFSFRVQFQKWLKQNSGKTYGEAIEAYNEIVSKQKKGTSEIDRQFEYNTYIRDFFADNQGKSLEQAIQCWKYKKSLQGKNSYDQQDLIALD